MSCGFINEEKIIKANLEIGFFLFYLVETHDLLNEKVEKSFDLNRCGFPFFLEMTISFYKQFTAKS